MLFRIFKFELSYRLKRPATWVYFGLMALLAFGAIAWEDLTIGGGAGQVKDNAPVVIALMMLTLTAIPGFLIVSAIMGVPILRDYEHQTSSMIFTTPIRKTDYLLGRFLGSFAIVVWVFLGALLGVMIGAQMPWLDPDRLVPFEFNHYLSPFLLFVLPNIFFASMIFFAGGALSRSLLFVFVQGIGMLVLYIIGMQLLQELDNRTLGAMLDPIGFGASRITSQYWSITEQNTQVYSFSGLIMANRLVWLTVGVLGLGLTLWRFSFSAAGTRSRKKKKKKAALQSYLSQGNLSGIAIPSSTLTDNLATHIKRILHLSRLYVKEIIFSIPFIAITIMGMVLLISNASNFNSLYGTETYPTTYQILEILDLFNLFFIILIVFYGGEIIWKERDIRMNQIFDAMPIPGFVVMIGKFLGMLVVYVLLLLLLILTGVLIQTFKGYYQYELGVYFSTLFTETLSFLIVYTLFVFFLQVIINQKLLTHAIVVLFFIFADVILPQIGLEHSMWQFGSGSLGRYSDMNTFGHFVTSFSWYKFYWLGFALLLFSVGVLLSVRGTDSLLKTRFQLAKLRFVRPVAIFSIIALMMFGFTGCYIYYNTTVVNEFASSDDLKEIRANYEKQLKQYKDLPQPKIVETNLKVDIFPETRDFVAEGYYILKNKSEGPISHIHIQLAADRDLDQEYITFERMDSLGAGETVVEESFEDFRYFIYKLDHPMQPGDSVRMNFKANYKTTGFVEGGGNTQVVYNGTFFNNTSFFPTLGYNEGAELSQEKDRKEYDLPPEKERMRKRNDPLGQKIPLVGDDADKIRFEIVMSTDTSQIAIAPGYLQRKWTEGDRHYFHYKMDKTMFNFYSIVSARYELVEEAWTTPQGQDVKLEIYYHPGHDYNLDRMMEAMKHSLSYYEENFSPYQFSQMRIMEFPRYATFAQSFANTVPFSEGIGFILNIGTDDVDMAYYVTAHEMAHQWWGHQVTEANVQGNAMLSESMSQYSALMVMKEKYKPELMQKFLRYELDSYLRGRANETKKELPLALVERQSYIHYRKGSVVMFALQDYIGEDSVNAALRRYLETWQGREDRYPTTADLLPYFREVTPDSLQYIIEDMFETITFFENRTEEPTYETLADDQYRVTIPVKAEKFRADSVGVQTPIPLQDWIDIGVYARGSDGKDSLVYLQKHKLLETETTVSVTVGAEPVKAGIDPLYKLIDRTPKDNVQAISLLD